MGSSLPWRLWGGSRPGVLSAARGNWYANTVGDPSIPLTLHARCTWLPSRWPRHLWMPQYRVSTPTSGFGHGASAEAVSYGADRAELSPQLQPYAPGASERVSVGPPSCLIKSWGSSAPTEHIPGWGVLSGWPNPTPCREKRSSALARVCSFPSWPEGPTGWGAWAPGPCVRTTVCETVQVWASHRGSWGCAHPVLSGEQGPPPRLWWRRGVTGTARRAGPCTDMPDPRTRNAGMACVAGGSRHESTRPSGRSLQTNLGDGRTWKCVQLVKCTVQNSQIQDRS